MEEQKQLAKELLQETGASVLYMNPKGEFFTVKNLAENSLEKGEKLQEFKPETTEHSETKEMTVSELEAHIEPLTEVSDVEALLEYEQNHENRKTAISLLEDKIAELKDEE